MKEPIKIYYRDATVADLDAIAENTILSMEYDPQWLWRFPLRKEFPEDHVKYTKYNFEPYLEPGSSWVIRVAETEDAALGGQRRIIAHGIWDFSSANKSGAGKNVVNNRYKETLDVRRDVDKDRMLRMLEDVAELKARWAARWPNGYIYFSLLCVNPDYFGHGAGPALCRWGMEQARAKNVPVALLASPMGRPVYDRLGFDNQGLFETKGGDGTRITMAIMGCEVNK